MPQVNLVLSSIMWFILSLVLLLCSTASESASFNFPRQKLPALTEKIEALLVNGSVITVVDFLGVSGEIQ